MNIYHLLGIMMTMRVEATEQNLVGPSCAAAAIIVDPVLMVQPKYVRCKFNLLLSPQRLSMWSFGLLDYS